MSYGVTKQGFVRKTYNDLFDELSARAKELFGPNINLSVFGVFGLLIRLFAWALSLIWQDHENTFYQLWIDDAEGEQLDFLVAFAGISREGAQQAVVTVEVSGEDGTTVEAGFVAQTAQKIQFATLESAVIADGKALIAARAVVAGIQGNVDAETLTSIFTPIAGVNSVTNHAAAVSGRAVETDDELRARYKVSRSLGAGASLPALTGLMRQVPGNIEAIIYENTGETIDEYGRPPGSIEAVVYGGVIGDYAPQLFSKRAAGVRAYGSASYNVIDANGQTRATGITLASERQVYVRLQITKNADWNDGNIAALKTAAIQYIGGNDTVDGIATSYIGLGIGQTAYTWEIIRSLGQIRGIKKIVAFLGFTEPATKPDELALGIREKARTNTASITVEFV